jgi:hypothetical protein
MSGIGWVDGKLKVLIVFVGVGASIWMYLVICAILLEL